ncbi:hypothetical protein HZC21_04610 [Candidatus Peregrinibacteria bacterium]|nr:hypothetical protein [Candidatus Peregrinibacteria bacterium]
MALDPQTYIEQGLKIVKDLVNKGDLAAAMNACQELLKVNPYDKSVHKYLQEIQERIIKENEKKVDADIESTMHLWKEGRFDELMQIYSKLYQYAPNHSRLIKLIEKLQEKMAEGQRKSRQDFLQKALAAIKGVINDGKFGDAIQACNEFLSLDPLNKEGKELLSDAKNRLIDQKLKENARVVEGADFERASQFYDTLLAINPENEKVKRLQETAASHLGGQKQLAGKIHFNESIDRMKQLFDAKEYEKVLQAAEEILHIEPKNLTAKIFMQKASATIDEEIGSKIVEKLKKAGTEAEQEYKKNAEGFVKI